MENNHKPVGIPPSSEPMVSRYLHAKARDKGIAVSGTFELTGRCNFRCKMCYVHDENSNMLKSEELPAEWWIKTAKDAVSQGLMFLLLTGGEALLRDDFEYIYSQLNKMGLIISLNTNGYLLNGKVAELFKKMPPNRINVSLYGTSEDSYKKFTGMNGFSRVIENIELMRSMGIQVRLNCSITQDNCDDMENIFALSRQLGTHIKTTSYMYPQIRINGIHGENETRLSPKEAAHYRVRWNELKNDPPEFIRKASEMKTTSERIEKSGVADESFGKVRCRAGKSSFWINKNGEMSPCGMLDKAFDVKELGFDEAWKKVKAYTASIVLPSECMTCKYRHICNVCAAVCYTETGDFAKAPDYVCQFSRETAKLTQIVSERLEKTK